VVTRLPRHKEDYASALFRFHATKLGPQTYITLLLVGGLLVQREMSRSSTKVLFLFQMYNRSIGLTKNVKRACTGIANLQKQVPGGSTCPSQAFADIKADIINASGYSRPSAVILLTDGNTTPQNLALAQAQAAGIRNQSLSTMFAIALGASGAAAHNELIQYIGGNTNQLFYANNANALSGYVITLDRNLL